MSISDTFNAFRGLKILIVGDVMIDRYLTGSADRISPEAPVPVVRLHQRDDRLGGAANVALNVAALGAKPYLCTVIGQDADAAKLEALMPEQQLSTRGLVRSAQRRTTVKTRILAGSQHLLRVDTEDTHPLSPTEAEQLLTAVRSILEAKAIDAILFQDYNKGVLSYEVINAITLEAVKRDLPTAVDPKFDNFWAYKHVTLFKPNLKEIRAQAPFPVDHSPASLDRAAAHIRSKLGNPFTIITLSEKGVYLNEQGQGQTLPTHPRSITDVCGAGDTVFAVAGLGLALKLPLQEIAQLANLAGGQVCEKVGVVPVDREQLEKEYRLLGEKGRL